MTGAMTTRILIIPHPSYPTPPKNHNKVAAGPDLARGKGRLRRGQGLLGPLNFRRGPWGPGPAACDLAPSDPCAARWDQAAGPPENQGAHETHSRILEAPGDGYQWVSRCFVFLYFNVFHVLCSWLLMVSNDFPRFVHDVSQSFINKTINPRPLIKKRYHSQ